ncbi:hypothetical protein [Gimesia sp.]
MRTIIDFKNTAIAVSIEGELFGAQTCDGQIIGDLQLISEHNRPSPE